MIGRNHLLSLLLLSALINTPIAAASLPTKSNIIIEPMNWWVGMKEPSLQLFIRGDNIKHADVALTPYPGVTLKSIDKSLSDDYLVLNLELGQDVKAGNLTLSFTTKGKTFTTQYPLLARSEGAKSRAGFSNKDVIYLLNPDRFANGDPSNDNHPEMLETAKPDERGGRHGGDLAGVAAHAEYLQDLGVTALWMTPVRENNMPSYSYHGYAMTDFYRVDPRFGTNEDYRALSKTLKRHGIGLIMDMVLNHSGSNHWWMTQPPAQDWVNFDYQFSGTTHGREAIQDPHASAYDKRQFNDGWFVPTMPDLNQRHPILATYLIQNSLWWIEYADLYGIRVDTYSYSDKAFLTEWTRRIMAEYPNFNIVGEEWTSNPAIAAYWQRGKVNHDGYVSYLPSVMDFGLQEATIKAMKEEESWGGGLVRIYQSLANDFHYPDTDNLLVFANNHDMSRVYTELNNDLALTKLAMGLLLTTRGIPQMYYGTEVLAHNNGSHDHGDIRIDFPGGFKGQTKNARTGEGLSDDEREMQNYIRTLLTLRKASNTWQSGKLTHFKPFDGKYVYFKTLGDETLMFVLNKSDDAHLELTRFSEITKGYQSANSLLTQSSQVLSEPLAITPRALSIFKLQK